MISVIIMIMILVLHLHLDIIIVSIIWPFPYDEHGEWRPVPAESVWWPCVSVSLPGHRAPLLGVPAGGAAQLLQAGRPTGEAAKAEPAFIPSRPLLEVSWVCQMSYRDTDLKQQQQQQQNNLLRHAPLM